MGDVKLPQAVADVRRSVPVKSSAYKGASPPASLSRSSYTFKFANSEAEMRGVWRLNHAAFAEELGQHETHEDGLLRDRFADKSRYLIALHSADVIGMLAVQDTPPFSVEQRLNDPTILNTIPGRRLEVRLLAIDPQHRNSMVLAGLLGTIVETAFRECYDAVLISGVAERADMYRRLGFHDLGPAVGTDRASFIPMAMRLADLPQRIHTDIRRWKMRRAG